MKKHLLPFLIALSLLLFASCDTASEPEAPTQENTVQGDTETNEATDTTAAETPSETDELEAPVKDGSFSTELYTVTDVDGVYYLNFADGNDATGELPNNAQVVGGPIYFADMDEMYRVLSEGKLTDDMVEQMKRCFQKTEQGIPIPNLNDLHEPVLPAGLQCTSVGVEGKVYSVNFALADFSITGQTEFLSKASFDSYYADEYVGYTDNEYLSNVTTEEGEFSGIPCTIIEHTTAFAEVRVLKFILEREDGRLSVLVQYCLSGTGSLLEPSDTIPYGIYMYYEGADGTYARIVVPTTNRELTLEWVQAFGATDYVPKAAE